MKKILCLLLTALFLFRDDGSVLSVEIDGVLVEEISLSALQEEKTLKYETSCGEIVVLADREGARVISAACANRLCVNSGKITKAGQSILCLPCKAVVRLEGAEEGLDGVTG